jgi:hypothetical protein
MPFKKGKMMSNPIAPSVTYPSPNEYPDTLRTITNITRAREATITSVAHGFDSDDIDVTSVDFLQVRGMTQINGLMGVIQEIPDADNFVVNINTTNFTAYSSGGVASIVTGTPALEDQGAQTFNTPFQNIF